MQFVGGIHINKRFPEWIQYSKLFFFNDLDIHLVIKIK